MAETQMASSPTEAADPFDGIAPTLTEFNRYRQSGEVPERVTKQAEAAEPAPAEKISVEGEKPEPAPDSTPDDDQEPPEGLGQKARRRFERLVAENKALKAAQQQVKPAEQTAPPAAPPAQQIPPTRPEPTLNDKNADGTLKYGDYQSFVKDLGIWSVEQAVHQTRQRDQQEAQTRQIQSKIERDRERYGDEFDKVIEPTAGAINGNASIPMEVKVMMAGSDVLPELLYTIGTDQKTMRQLERLAKENPAQAVRYIATLEVGIREELAADSPDDSTPAPEPKRTSAPKPPVPVSGPSSRAFDVTDTSLSAEEWMRKRNAQLAQRGR